LNKFPKSALIGTTAAANLKSLATFFGVDAVLVDANGKNADTTVTDTNNYGGYYEVIRSWALNIPIYVRRATKVFIARPILLKDGSVYNLLISKTSVVPTYNDWCQWKSGTPEQKEMEEMEEMSNFVSENLEGAEESADPKEGSQEEPSQEDGEGSQEVESSHEVESSQEESSQESEEVVEA